MEKDPMWVIVSHLFVFCHGLLELGGHLFDDFGVLGSSLDVFGAWGSREPILSKYVAPLVPFWLHFGFMFGVQR